MMVPCCCYYPLDLDAGGTVPRRNPGVDCFISSLECTVSYLLPYSSAYGHSAICCNIVEYTLPLVKLYWS
jgi:hypothetical protein